MTGTITSLQVQKNNKERVNVYIDGEYALAVTLNVALELKKGQHLSEAEIERLKSDDQRNKAFDRALSYLSYRARSQTEIERYLSKKEYSPEVIADTLDRLAEYGYLDDAAFAEAWVRERERLKPRGARALRYELRRKGVADAAIDQALESLDETALARQAIEPKLRQWQGLDQHTFRRKASGFLGRRGFGYDIIREVVAQGWAEIDQDDEDIIC